MYPLKFEPIYKKKIWGGRGLEEKFNRELPEGLIGESWELAAHKNGESKVVNGALAGKTLMEVVKDKGEDLLGREAKDEDYDKFPLLIKILDANDKLSVQVHPGDEYAAKYEDGELGKTEMWYVIDAQKDAKLVYGVKPDVTEEELATSIKEGRLQDNLVEINVKKGDVIHIPTGTVHTIIGGVLIAEIQQNSDTTYRVYDWNRIGKDGKSRELHVDSALDVIEFGVEPKDKVEGLEINNEGYTRRILVACPYFVTEVLDIVSTYKEDTAGESFVILMVLEGEGELSYLDGEIGLESGETLLLPAALGEYEIEGSCKLIKSYLKDISKLKEELKSEDYSDEDIDSIFWGS